MMEQKKPQLFAAGAESREKSSNAWTWTGRTDAIVVWPVGNIVCVAGPPRPPAPVTVFCPSDHLPSSSSRFLWFHLLWSSSFRFNSSVSVGPSSFFWFRPLPTARQQPSGQRKRVTLMTFWSASGRSSLSPNKQTPNVSTAPLCPVERGQNRW